MRVLLTGVVEGLGRALCDRLLGNGHTVVGLDNNGAGLAEMADRPGLSLLCVDLCVAREVERAIKALCAEAPFDMVIFNAGISATGRFEDIPATAYAKLLCINVETPMVMASQLLANAMIAPGGSVVFVSSLSHITGYPGASVYCASKDALATYAKSIRPACAARGVNVLCVFPGPLQTAHAARHSPTGSKAEKRMSPDLLAQQILEAAKNRRKNLYPGRAAKFAHIAGRLSPNTMCRIMRRLIFEKLDKTTY